MGSWRPPREDRPGRRPRPYRGPPVTVRDVRQHGVTQLLVYCTDLVCNHSGTLPLAPLPDDLVLLTLDPRCRCTKCGRKGGETCGRIGHRTPGHSGGGNERDGVSDGH
jgi:hypothetical protein